MKGRPWTLPGAAATGHRRRHSLTLASHEDEEQNHLSLISLEATKGIRAGGEQAPGGAGITS